MTYYQGRLIDHVHLRVADLAASKAFYRAVFDALGMTEAFGEGDGCFYADEFYVDRAEDAVSRIHVAFRAKSADEVARFHRAALQAGGRDNGAPGFRSYRRTYYAAFVLDPDGNNIEALWDGPTQRSADAVWVERVALDEEST